MISITIDKKEYELVTKKDLEEIKKMIKKLLKIIKEEKTYPEDLFDRFLKEVEQW